MNPLEELGHHPMPAAASSQAVKGREDRDTPVLERDKALLFLEHGHGDVEIDPRKFGGTREHFFNLRPVFPSHGGEKFELHRLPAVQTGRASTPGATDLVT